MLPVYLLPVILQQAFLQHAFYSARIFAVCHFATSIPAARIFNCLYFCSKHSCSTFFTDHRQCWIAQQLVQSRPVAFLLTIVCVHADSTGLHIWAASIHNRERSDRSVVSMTGTNLWRCLWQSRRGALCCSMLYIVYCILYIVCYRSWKIRDIWRERVEALYSNLWIWPCLKNTAVM